MPGAPGRELKQRERDQPGVRIGSLQGDIPLKEKAGSVEEEQGGQVGTGQPLEVLGVRWQWWSPNKVVGQWKQDYREAFIHSPIHSFTQ